MNVLQINTTYNSGSTGRIASQIGKMIVANGGHSFIAYGRGFQVSNYSKLFRIGSKFDFYIHALLTRLFDLHGYGSYFNTKRLIKFIEKNKIDIIHLHNLHGYFLNLKVLFDYLKTRDLPVLWTLHDCWTFTGHCAHYMNVNCNKWQSFCHNCPQLNSYPASIFWDNSKSNFFHKKHLFSSLSNLTLVPVSKWLETELHKSFFSDKKITCIQNGIDLTSFTPEFAHSNSKLMSQIGNKKIILGVANVWTEKKGLNDFIRLSTLLSSSFKIVLVGVNSAQKNTLPENIIGITKTENIDELVSLYSHALVLFNPTYEDTFPTINLEAIACGTPVITYNTGGSPESITNLTGIIVNQGDLDSVVNSIELISLNDREQLRIDCRNNALASFDMLNSFDKYIQLYKKLILL
jgi:glycosyltransferase involved in cell wall biosynthesis